jgi:hypothetical protein
MFESFRQTLQDLMDRGTPPEERRAGLARMKDTLIHAKMGLEDLRGGVEQSRQRLAVEEREVQTMRRRKEAAAGINDAETVALSEKYEAHHAERAEVLRRKLDAQEAEFAMVERDVSEMTAALKQAMAGVSTGPSRGSLDDAARAEVDSLLGRDTRVGEEIDSIAREGRRANREAEADRQLAELKKRMGK